MIAFCSVLPASNKARDDDDDDDDVHFFCLIYDLLACYWSMLVICLFFNRLITLVDV